jgi:hypothetical protein
MENLTRKQFKKLAKIGRIRQGTGQDAPGEDRCETWFEHGIANGFSLADICHFYMRSERLDNHDREEPLTRSEMVDAAYEQFVEDISYFNETIAEAAQRSLQVADHS